jgi:hypothetical protein
MFNKHLVLAGVLSLGLGSALVAHSRVYKNDGGPRDCGFTIKNDSNYDIMVQCGCCKDGIIIRAGNKAEVNPTCHSHDSYHRRHAGVHKTVDIFFKDVKDDGTFRIKYRLHERICSENGEGKVLTLTKIKEMVKEPTKRFWVREFDSRGHRIFGTGRGRHVGRHARAQEVGDDEDDND